MRVHSCPKLVAAATALTLLLLQRSYAGEAPQEIMQRVRDTYGQLHSYSDSGVLLQEYGAAQSPSRERSQFTTWFNRAPRRFHFEFRKAGGDRLVIWGDPGAFHTWWKATGVTADYPNPNNLPAINLSDFPTSGAVTKIPTLLYPKAALLGALTHFTDLTLAATEDLAGHRCYRLTGTSSDLYGQTGKAVNTRRLTVWIDASSMLIRQISEEYPVVAGQIHRITTSFEPQTDPALPEAGFGFTPPVQR